MSSGIYLAMTGARAQEQRLDAVTNNLANVRTAGYKKQSSVFRQVHHDPTRLGNPNQALGVHHPVRFLPEDRTPTLLERRYTQWAQGALQETGNALDLAIEGDGFFEVQGPGGETVFTRNGSFTLARDGTLVDARGFPLLSPEGLAVRVPPGVGEVRVSADGTVSAGDQPMAQIAVARFAEPETLERLGDSHFRAPDPAAAQRVAAPEIHQGYLEGSNASPVQLMMEMIKTSRLFELSTRALQAYKAMDDTAAREVGRLG